MRGQDGVANDLERLEKARDFLLVPEFTSRLDGRMTALLVHHALLLTEPHPEAVTAVQAALSSGASLLAVITDITNSDEFQRLYK
jgi:hypothetical protein